MSNSARTWDFDKEGDWKEKCKIVKMMTVSQSHTSLWTQKDKQIDKQADKVQPRLEAAAITANIYLPHLCSAAIMLSPFCTRSHCPSVKLDHNLGTIHECAVCSPDPVKPHPV
ncbi:hypothetical protein F2P81_010927 [Scophthalmus maximus]|uniref:Uncharacterized protein n=1 Tax=Scophthalmus maximus TaxID=52904 RepID=A0A6A4SVX0_SCOMX|nr:hypothetical protein F2P81_010927 [Scophthalmus maximus]